MRITKNALDLFQGAETSEPVTVDETLLLRRGSHPRMIAELATCRIPGNLATMRAAGLSDPRIYPLDFPKTLSSDIDEIDVVGTDEANLLYLIGRFWARVEILRRQSIAADLHAHPKGAILDQFFACLESRRVRLVDRGLQRAIGETLIADVTPDGTKFFIDFAAELQNEEGLRRWYQPLYGILSRTVHTAERQRILQFGAVLHALIDVLDPNHQVTGDRPGWPNKLTRRTRRALRYRVFGVYLKLVRDPQKYSGPH